MSSPPTIEAAVALRAVEASLEAVRALLAQIASPPTTPATPLAPVAATPGRVDLTRFDQRWKHKRRFTELGRRAIQQAFAEGMSPQEAAALFRIGVTSAQTYRRRCEGRQTWPYNRAPGAAQ